VVELSGLVNSSLDIQTVLDNAMACAQMSMNADASAMCPISQNCGEQRFFPALFLGVIYELKRTMPRKG
jgi:hypothetical protein